MIDAFKSFIADNKLCSPDEPVLLTVSGGIDSIVMTDLFYRAGYSFSILHCNFGLRGDESDADETFVRQLGTAYEANVHIQSFDTEEYAIEKGISIQMAARELRYNWFDEISEEFEIQSIATAHNLNDSIETVLLNLSRGTGLKGICGIPVKNGKYIRPILFAARKEIQDYCQHHGLQYREDSSNSSKKYHRNKIRHDVIPVLEEINPAFLETMSSNIYRFRESYVIYKNEVQRIKQELFSHKGTITELSIARIKDLKPLNTWLFELFSDFGFSQDQCAAIKELLDAEPGKQIVTESHSLYKDRDSLILSESKGDELSRYYIDDPTNPGELPFGMDMEVIDKEQFKGFSPSHEIACLDLDKLNFPLVVRKWKAGDYFYPLGMEHMKKVSDFFIDNKVPVPVKNNTWILCSGKNIVWIMGFRIDNRYRISEETRKILRLEV